MGEAIVITSGKGGVGKSACTVNIGVSLAAAGRRTVLVDVDIGLRSLDVLLGLENHVIYDLVDVAEGVCRLRQALLADRAHPRLTLLAAAQLRDDTAVGFSEMTRIIDTLKAQFDYVLIDCPAGIGRGFRNAICAADRALLVTTPDPICLRDAERMCGLIDKYGLPVPALIVNRSHSKEALTYLDCAQRLQIPVLGVVPEDRWVGILGAGGTPVVDRNTQSGKAFRRIAERLQGKEVRIRAPYRSRRFSQRRVHAREA